MPFCSRCRQICSNNAIPAYAYPGDVSESPTDKRAQTFEDSFRISSSAR